MSSSPVSLVKAPIVRETPVGLASTDFYPNAVYRAKSGPFATYFRKRCYVLLWDNNCCIVRFIQDGPLYRLSRNHVIID